MDTITQLERERLEIHFWEASENEGAGVFSLDNILNKMSELPIFAAELKQFSADFARAGTILEVGGGQLWSSCFLKARYPGARVIGSDIGAAAVASAPTWEGIFRVTLDDSFACTSYEIPLPDQSCDIVYAFQAAHHFGDHKRTFAEVARVLRPGCVLLYLAEPVCSRLVYPIALKRVNSIRPEVREDLLVLSDMKRLAGASGLTMQHFPRSEIIHPNLKKILYYSVLDTVTPLRQILPSAMSLRFVKH